MQACLAAAIAALPPFDSAMPLSPLLLVVVCVILLSIVPAPFTSTPLTDAMDTLACSRSC